MHLLRKKIASGGTSGALGSEHTDLFGLTDVTKTCNSFEDFHCGFHVSPCGKDVLLCRALVRPSIISVSA